MASHYLETEYEFSFCLVGINCHDRDYRLAWDINRNLHWNLVRVEDLVSGSVGAPDYYTCFRSTNEEDNIGYSLISNRSAGGPLYPDLVHFDYLLKIENMEDVDPSLLVALRRLRTVSACFRIELESLRSRYQLFTI